MKRQGKEICNDACHASFEDDDVSFTCRISVPEELMGEVADFQEGEVVKVKICMEYAGNDGLVLTANAIEHAERAKVVFTSQFFFECVCEISCFMFTNCQLSTKDFFYFIMIEIHCQEKKKE